MKRLTIFILFLTVAALLVASVKTPLKAQQGMGANITLLAVNGTKAAPAYAFSAQTSSGVFYDGNGVGLSQGGTESVSANANGPELLSGGILAWSNSASDPTQAAQTGISSDAAGLVDVGTGAAGSVAGILRAGNTVAVASNFTTASTSLVLITGLTWTFPATAHNYSFSCNLSYSQATAAAANAFGVQAATTAPTNLYAAMDVSTGLAITGVDATLPTLASTTATNIGTFTPSAFGAIGTVADIFVAHVWGRLEQGAGATTLNIMVLTGSASDSITMYRGSTCTLYP